jgi:hypothetical protein
MFKELEITEELLSQLPSVHDLMYGKEQGDILDWHDGPIMTKSYSQNGILFWALVIDYIKDDEHKWIYEYYLKSLSKKTLNDIMNSRQGMKSFLLSKPVDFYIVRTINPNKGILKYISVKHIFGDCEYTQDEWLSGEEVFMNPTKAETE